MAWPKGKPRGPRKDHHQSPEHRTAAQRLVRASQAEARGRSGEVLSRKRTVSSDIFHIPQNIVPPGWDYQWNVIEVLGQPQTGQQLAMAENGWRAVPAGRHKGMFMPEGTPDDAAIIRDGLRLEERPLILTEEARDEEMAKARKQVRDQQEALRLGPKLPEGFSDNERYRGTGAVTRQSIERAPDTIRPRHQLDIDQ